MSQTSPKSTSKCLVRDIRRATRQHHSAEDKICFVRELRGEDSIAGLCREPRVRTIAGQGIPDDRLAQCGSDYRSVEGTAHKGRALNEVVAERALQLQLLKKGMIADEGEAEGVLPHPKSSRSSGSSSSRTCHAAHAGAERRGACDLLPQVQALWDRRPQGAGRSALTTRPGLELHSGRSALAPGSTGLRGPPVAAASDGSADHGAAETGVPTGAELCAEIEQGHQNSPVRPADRGPVVL